MEVILNLASVQGNILKYNQILKKSDQLIKQNLEDKKQDSIRKEVNPP